MILLVSPAMRGCSAANSEPPAFGPDAARALLAEAGYPDGFGFGLKCPDNRYLNDEAVCQAVVGMLARLGIQSEIVDSKRQAMLDEYAKILRDEHAYVTLYVQPLVRGARDNIDLTQRADNFFILRWTTVN